METDATKPVTRAEFEQLIAIVREMAGELAYHTHGYSTPDSTYGEQTSTPNTPVLDGVWRRLDALLDWEPEPKDNAHADPSP